MDEAHNLPDRLRSMYSAELNRDMILAAQDILRDAAPGLAKGLVAILKEMTTLKTVHLGQNKFYSLTDLPEPFMEVLDEFADKAELWLDNHQDSPLREPVLDIFYPVNGFLNLSRNFWNPLPAVCPGTGNKNLAVRLFCLDPASHFLKTH